MAEPSTAEPIILTADDSIELSRAALCLDCERVFRIERGRCPRCDSWAWVPLQKFLTEHPERVVRSGERRR